jgi:hypothetical protein
LNPTPECFKYRVRCKRSKGMKRFTVHRGTKIWASAVAALVVVCSAGFANTTNAIPYGASFEAYATGTEVAGSDGWYGISNAATVVAGDLMPFPWGHPIAGAHSNVLELMEPITNLFTRYTPADEDESVYIDLLVDPIPRENPPGNLPDDVQTALYLGENGQLNAYHAMYPPAGGSAIKLWSELDHAPLPTSEWIRVTLDMKYAKDVFANSTDKYFRVAINGGDWLIHSNGYDQLPLQSATNHPGPWFLQAGSGGGKGNTYLTSLSTEGPGAIDDLVVTTNAPSGSASGTIRGVPVPWYQANGFWNPDGDADGDGSPNWAEWVAGTDARDPNSKLEFTAADKTTFTWSGTTNTGDTATYRIFRRPDLLTGDWGQPYAAGIPKGDTTWTDAGAPMTPGANYSYKLDILWEWPDGQ